MALPTASGTASPTAVPVAGEGAERFKVVRPVPKSVVAGGEEMRLVMLDDVLAFLVRVSVSA